MANERVVTELILEGANKVVRELNSVAQATTGLVDIQTSVGVRQRQVYDSVARASEDAAKRQEEASRRVEQTSQATTAALERDARRAKAVQDEVARTAQRAALSSQSQGGLLARTGGALPTAPLFDPRAATQQTTAVQRLQNVLNSLGTTIQRVIGLTRQQTQAQQLSTQAIGINANAINQSSQAQQGAQRQGITYLSTLSAIHAASFLASNRTFTLVGSFFTLGAAFSRLGPLAVTVGVAFGGLLLAINSINRGIELLQQVFIGLITTLTRVAAVATAAAAAAGTAGVKLAADVETQLGLIKAIEDPTIEALQAVEQQITQLALRFGVSAKDVAEAASLYVRAGGDIKEGFDEALKSIIELQIASAGELQAAQAARTVAVGLRAFAKEGATAADVANAITRAAQASALSFTEVNQAFQQAVPGAVTLGIKLDELAGVIAVLGNNALRGTVAGTSFKQFLLDLINPSSKAADILAELGVGIADSSGAIRPFVDILDDLSAALDDSAVASGRITEAQRAQAIAAIFGSRAALSSNILIRESTEALRAFREETEATTAANVADVMLLPLNTQLRILKVSVEEVGRAFGAPLLQPIREAAANAIVFVQQLIPLATLAGQAVAVVLTDQGFGALRAEISKVVKDNRLAIFFIELVNTFRNVRDVIVNQIIPAIQDFFITIGLVATESGRLTDVVNGFNNINRAIQVAGAFIVVFIRNLGQLAAEFIHNDSTGGRLRDTLDTLATRVLVTLTTNIAILVPAIVGAILTMGVFVDIALAVTKAVLNAALAVSELGANLKLFNLQKDIEVGIERAKLKGDTEEVERLEASLARLNKTVEVAPRDNAIRDILNQINLFSNERHRIQGTIDRLGADIQVTNTQIIRSFENTLGELPDILSNIRAAAEREIAGIEDDRERTTGVGLGVDDEKLQREIDRVIERIREAGRDIARTLDRLAEDSSTRISNIVARALERIGDIGEKLDRDLAKLARDTQDRIDDLRESVTQRRSDRARQEHERDQQEALLKLVQLSLDLQERAQERSLEDTRRLRQRQVEEVQRDYDLQAEAAERSFSQQQEAAERAFRNQQKAQEQALDAQQTVEEKLLQDRLDREKRDRDNRRRLAEAKTPEEQQRVFQDITRQRDDLKFEERQQEQIDALKKRHDEQRFALQTTQEQAAINFRQSQEQVALSNRLKREQTAIEFRRRLEDQEHAQRRVEEDATFNRRLFNEIKLDQIRHILARRTRELEDRLEDESTKRRERQIIRDARKRESDLIQEAERQRREIFDQVNQQLDEQEQTVNRAIRRALERLDDIEDSLTPDVRAVVAGVLAEVRGSTAKRAQDLVEQFQLETQQARSVVGAQLAVTTPQSVLATGLEVTAKIILPNNYTSLIAQGVLFALQTYGAAQDTEPPIINIEVPPNDIFGQLSTRR